MEAHFTKHLKSVTYTDILSMIIIYIVNIPQFVWELSRMVEILQSENNYTANVGDFIIGLLQIAECDKFVEFFDLMCTNNLFPKIAFPARFAKHSCSCTDQIFYTTPPPPKKKKK